MAFTAPRTWTVAEIATGSLMNAQVRDNLLQTMAALAQAAGDTFYATGSGALARLALGAANRALRVDSGATALEWGDHNALMPWSVSISPAEGLTGETGVWTCTVRIGFGGADYASDGVQNREIYWDLLLSAGTWKFGFTYLTHSDHGIFDVQLDGSSIGTVDSYSAGSVANVYSEITGISVATAGKKRLKLVISTKNASSSSYLGRIQHLAMVRTA